MPAYKKFVQSLLPGNYALTKSMELTKKTTSGTLWYTKKYLVLYNYIFLSEDIFTNEYIERVIEAFDNFIETLHESVQPAARRYFYPDQENINFKSPNFKSFMSFANKTGFRNIAEQDDYRAQARKCYFAFLMGSGGQGGIKEQIVDAIKKPDFHYSPEKMQKIIDHAVVLTSMDRCARNQRLSSGDIPRILSTMAINEIERTAKTQQLTEEIVKDIILRYPCSIDFPGKYGGTVIKKPSYRAVENDAFASTRNERQILFYYGYFHSKSAKGSDVEFSSLTPIGELALNANSHEFLAIWEHQKIKMISQPATADINNIVPCQNSPDSFSISYTPYTDILGHIVRKGSLTLDQYKYIVSRRSHRISEEEWIRSEEHILSELPSLKAIVTGFGREGDIKNEDGRKELLKYTLGILSDLPVDNASHEYGMLSFDEVVAATDNKRLWQLYKVYSALEKYKAHRNKKLFEECEKDLRRRYAESLSGFGTDIDPRVKINWDLYNIRVDEVVLFGVMLTSAAFDLSIDIFSDAGNRKDVDEFVANLNQRYSSLLRKIGFKNNSAKKTQIKRVLAAIISNDFSFFTTEATEDYAEVIADYREADAEGLLVRIKGISRRTSIIKNGVRVRDPNLVGLLKAYYMTRFMDNNLLKCECCGNETFITQSGEPYVEFHHLIPFNIANGPDHYLNLYALCPNCHRKIHFLHVQDKAETYEELNQNNYWDTSIVQRLKELKKQKILRSYHLEYLLAENAITAQEYDAVVA